jgi:hypothetical protein
MREKRYGLGKGFGPGSRKGFSLVLNFGLN